MVAMTVAEPRRGLCARNQHTGLRGAEYQAAREVMLTKAGSSLPTWSVWDSGGQESLALPPPPLPCGL